MIINYIVKQMLSSVVHYQMFTCGIFCQVLVSFVAYHIFTYDSAYTLLENFSAYQMVTSVIGKVKLRCVMNY